MNAEKETILIANLNDETCFDDLNQGIYGTLVREYKLDRANAPTSSIHRLKPNNPLSRLSPPAAVLLVDGAIARPENKKALEALVDYVRAGGVAICCTQFSSFVRPLDDLPEMLKALGLQWESGDYSGHRLTLSKRSVLGAAGLSGLVEGYSTKSLHLKNVTYEEAVFIAKDAGGQGGQAGVAFTKVDYGFFGYIGDVNCEVGSAGAVLAMVGYKAYSSRGHSSAKGFTGAKEYVGQKELYVPPPIQYNRDDYADKSVCHNCSMPPDEGRRLLTCNGCKVTRYCSKECQEEHWSDWHSKECKVFQQQKGPRKVMA